VVGQKEQHHVSQLHSNNPRSCLCRTCGPPFLVCLTAGYTSGQTSGPIEQFDEDMDKIAVLVELLRALPGACQLARPKAIARRPGQERQRLTGERK
jgi:hypothetical protein